MARKKSTPDVAQSELPEPEAVLDEPESVLAEEPQDVSEAPETESDQPVPDDEPEMAADAEPEPAVIPPTSNATVARKGGFGAMALGGVVAAAIGAGAAWYVLPRVPGLLPPDDAILARLDAAEADLKSTQAALGDSRDQVATLGEQISQLSGNLDAMSGERTALQDGVSQLKSQIVELQARPVPSSTPSAETMAAVDAEMQKMQARLDAELETLRAAKEAASQEEANVEALTKRSELTAAVTQVRAAVSAGMPYADVMPRLEAATSEIDPIITQSAETGVTSVAQLQDSFPQAARDALAVSVRVVADDTTTGRFSAFLKNQLGVRSLEPREGTDPDAVLSRAEAALKQGNLTETLAQIQALPEEGQTAIAGWVDLANKNLAVTRAIDALAQDISQ